MMTRRGLPFGVVFLTALLALPLLPACGYSPAGIAASTQLSWPDSLRRLSLSGLQPYDPLRRALTAELRAYGVQLVSPQAAAVQLQIVETRESPRTISYDRRAKSREQLITMQVDFLLRSPEGQVLLKKQTITAESVYLYDAARYLESRSEKKAVAQALSEQLSRQLVRRLAASLGHASVYNTRRGAP